MKSWILILAFMLTQVALAQSLPVEEKILKKLDRLQKMVNRGKLAALNRGELQDIDLTLKGVIQNIRLANGGGPGGGGGHYQMLTVEGYLEKRKFDFSGATTAQIFNDCVAYFESSHIGSVDDLHISINGNMIQHVRNSRSYWRTADQICTVIENKLMEQQNVVAPSVYLDVVGRIESTPFSFSAQTIGGAFFACMETVGYVGSVDDVYISVNGSRREHYRNSRSYWSGDLQICRLITSKL